MVVQCIHKTLSQMKFVFEATYQEGKRLAEHKKSEMENEGFLLDNL